MSDLIKIYGAPYILVSDGSQEKLVIIQSFNLGKYEISHKIFEPKGHNQNPTQGVIKELR